MSCHLITDPDYLKFLDKLKNADNEAIPPPESLLEEIEAKEKLLKGINCQKCN